MLKMVSDCYCKCGIQCDPRREDELEVGKKLWNDVSSSISKYDDVNVTQKNYKTVTASTMNSASRWIAKESDKTQSMANIPMKHKECKSNFSNFSITDSSVHQIGQSYQWQIQPEPTLQSTEMIELHGKAILTDRWPEESVHT
ncbi:unnamed protein product, partial [Thelazia callipaeda]|uniref:SCP domain-containing protein n=1 Tax=Thelazia callipaeda TaxID=103827 RepID=A0A0N5CNV4_THECL